MGVLLAVLVWAASAAFAKPGVEVWPQSVEPGGAVFVTVQPEAGSQSGACAWMKKSYDLCAAKEGLRAVLPVPADAKPGSYQLVVAGGQDRQQFTVTVRPRKFGIQRLRLSAKQEAKYEAPSVQREYRLISAALKKVTPEALWEGNFLMPVQGRVSTQYGLQRYVNGHFDYRHKGMDLAAGEGTPVKAAADGVVSLADGSFLLHGKTIIVDHGLGVSTLYLHLSRIEVTPGMRVKRGQIIGRVGHTGAATGPHLHYGLYVHREAEDPAFFTRLTAR